MSDKVYVRWVGSFAQDMSENEREFIVPHRKVLSILQKMRAVEVIEKPVRRSPRRTERKNPETASVGTDSPS